MTSSRRSRGRCGRRPSALSASPSRWSMPVSPRSTRDGHGSGERRRPHLARQPPRAPDGEADEGTDAREPGHRRCGRASRPTQHGEEAEGGDHQGLRSSGSTRPATTSSTLSATLGDGRVDVAEQLAEAPADLGGGVHAEAHLVADQDGVARAPFERDEQRRRGPASRRRARPPRCRASRRAPSRRARASAAGRSVPHSRVLHDGGPAGAVARRCGRRSRRRPDRGRPVAT